jgi:hypothetical protein
MHMGGVWFFGLGAKHFPCKDENPPHLKIFFTSLWRGLLHSKVILQKFCRAPAPAPAPPILSYFNHCSLDISTGHVPGSITAAAVHRAVCDSGNNLAEIESASA